MFLTRCYLKSRCNVESAKNLQEINNALSNNEATLKDILSLVYSPRPVMERQWSFDNERRKDEDLDKDRIERDLSIE